MRSSDLCLKTSRYQHSVMLVCKNGTTSSPLRHALTSNGFAQIVSRNTYSSAVTAASESQPDIVFFDAFEPEGSEMKVEDFIHDLLEHSPKSLLIAVSLKPAAENIFKVIRLGARGYLIPPFSPEATEEVLLRATQDPEIDPRILQEPDRNLALAKLILHNLHNLSDYMKLLGSAIEDIESGELDYKTVIAIDRLMVVFTQSVRAAKLFCKGTEEDLMKQIHEICLDRAMPKTKLGDMRKKLRKQRASELTTGPS